MSENLLLFLSVPRDEKCESSEARRTRIEIFQRWDEDKNGFLDYTEVDRAIHQSFSREMISMILGRDNLQDKFGAIDANGDGRISFAEMYNEVKRTSCCNFHPHFKAIVWSGHHV